MLYSVKIGPLILLLTGTLFLVIHSKSTSLMDADKIEDSKLGLPHDIGLKVRLPKWFIKKKSQKKLIWISVKLYLQLNLLCLSSEM